MAHGGRRLSPLPPNWRRIRAGILDRDGHRCRLRFPYVCTGTATEVHHTIAHDYHHPDGLAAACSECHARVTGHDAAAARRRKYDRRRPPEPHPGMVGETP